MQPHPYLNFAISRYYLKELQCNFLSKKIVIPTRKGGVYLRNIDKYDNIGNGWVACYGKNDNASVLNILLERWTDLEVKEILKKGYTERKHVFQWCLEQLY